MGTTIKVPNREIAIRAFDHLRQERKTDSALRAREKDRLCTAIGSSPAAL